VGDDEEESPPTDWIEEAEERTTIERAFEPAPPPKPAVPRPEIDPWVELTPAKASEPPSRAVLGATLTVPRKPITPPKTPRPPSSERAYPKMRALLQNPSVVPYGNAAPPPPPVPGTFFPAPREPIRKAEPADLDALLTTMADGLLIGEMPDGGTEVRVTLKDEFFAGTELRIAVGDGEVKATLVPPDREVYWTLNANVEALKERLEARGLKVTEVTVVEP
jgi:hypothetical protein